MSAQEYTAHFANERRYSLLNIFIKDMSHLSNIALFDLLGIKVSVQHPTGDDDVNASDLDLLVAQIWRDEDWIAILDTEARLYRKFEGLQCYEALDCFELVRSKLPEAEMIIVEFQDDTGWDNDCSHLGIARYGDRVLHVALHDDNPTPSWPAFINTSPRAEDEWSGYYVMRVTNDLVHKTFEGPPSIVY